MIREAMTRAITKNSLLLGLFALTVAAGLAGTELVTRELRAESQRKVQSMALREVISDERHDNSLLDDRLPVDDKTLLQLRNPGTIHVARMKGEVVAFILPVRAPDGYGGAIDAIVGINLDGSIAGVRVISHQETPGLGDKVELKKSPWVLSFNGRSLANTATDDWRVKKDKGVFDQFTGATITPRAMVKAVHNALQYFALNKTTLLEQASHTATGAE